MSNSKPTLCEFDAERVVVNNIDGEGEVLIHLTKSDDPVVLYLDYVDYIAEILDRHPEVDYDS